MHARETVRRVRAELDRVDPGWRAALRADLDAADPGWAEAAVSVLNPDGTRPRVVLLANPSALPAPASLSSGSA